MQLVSDRLVRPAGLPKLRGALTPAKHQLGIRFGFGLGCWCWVSLGYGL